MRLQVLHPRVFAGSRNPDQVTPLPSFSHIPILSLDDAIVNLSSPGWGEIAAFLLVATKLQP